MDYVDPVTTWRSYGHTEEPEEWRRQVQDATFACMVELWQQLPQQTRTDLVNQELSN
jgi:hypothetical protein